MEKVKKRSRFLAFFLSLLVPGLGQLYCGSAKDAISIYAEGFILVMLMGLANITASYVGMSASFIAIIGFNVLAAINSIELAGGSEEIRLKGYNKWYIYVIIIYIQMSIAVPSIKNHLFPYRSYKIPTTSMMPTLGVGDHIMTNTTPCKSSPRRGDVVVFPYPKDPSIDYVKRVIGLPGDKIEIRDKVVWINEIPLEEPYVQYIDSKILPANQTSRDNMGAIVVPENAIFVMGDNRDDSSDSRSWKFVDIASIKGKALYIFDSSDRPVRRLD